MSSNDDLVRALARCQELADAGNGGFVVLFQEDSVQVNGYEGHDLDAALDAFLAAHSPPTESDHKWQGLVESVLGIDSLTSFAEASRLLRQQRKMMDRWQEQARRLRRAVIAVQRWRAADEDSREAAKAAMFAAVDDLERQPL